MSRYLNPYTDFGFKKLFGEEANKDLLIDFLNQLLPAHHQIAELNFRSPEQLPEIPLDRKAIFDINCISITGERFIVEMQKAKMQFFKDRSVYYVTFPIREQAKKGDWLFKLDPVYFIAILDFVYDEAIELQKFRRDVALRDQDGQLFFDKLHFKFLQMPLFTKQADELETHFDKWLYFLKHLEDFEQIPTILNEPVFQKAFRIAEIANLNREQSVVYEKNLLDYWTTKAAFVTAHEEGRARGREEGATQQALETANKMLDKGYNINEVAELTGLSLAQLSFHLGQNT
ncbi:MAG: Rpn family recombination-promoting nuclease/putative transposase [Thiotrichaceae bacterium]